MNNITEPLMKLDIEEVLKMKAPRYYKFIPGFIINWLKRVICQDQLNNLLENNKGKTGVDFATGILKDLGIKINIEGKENIPEDGRFIFASNHPLGALDGLAIISYLGEKYNGNIKFLVNDILMAIKPLNDVFLPINKHGGQAKKAIQTINHTYAGNDQIIIFPAGLCSRNLKGKIIEDLRWQKGFISKSVEYKRDIIPVYFEGYNSRFFYRLGKIRRRLGIKINIEMIYLPSEIFKSINNEYTIWFGSPIKWENFAESKDLLYAADKVKKIVYNLKPDK